MNRPKIEFRSSGESGNIHHILMLVKAALRKARWINDYNELYCAVTTSGSYKEALGIIRQTVDLVDLDGKF